MYKTKFIKLVVYIKVVFLKLSQIKNIERKRFNNKIQYVFRKYRFIKNNI